MAYEADGGKLVGFGTELFCDRDNARGIAFWQKMGFQDIGNSEGNEKYRRFIRWPWPAADTDSEPV